METRSGKKLSTSSIGSAGNLNGRQYNMTTPCLPGTSPTKACTSPKATTSVQNECTQADATCIDSFVRNEQSQLHGDVNFEKLVMLTLNKILAGQKELRNDLESFKTDICKTVEFQGQEISDIKSQSKQLSTRVDNVTTSVNNAWGSINTTQNHVAEIWDGMNKMERQSRRNNIRFIGVSESAGENIEEIVDNIFKTKFDRQDIEIERAHRDGKRKQMRGEDAARPRHIIVKLLRYKDKVDIMKKRREALKDESYHVVEDLRKVDLEMKQSWSEKVRALYQKGIKLRFIAGLWRDRNGKRAPFYNKPNETLEGESAPPLVDTDIIGFAGNSEDSTQN